jgi:hypothetical protein
VLFSTCTLEYRFACLQPLRLTLSGLLSEYSIARQPILQRLKKCRVPWRAYGTEVNRSAQLPPTILAGNNQPHWHGINQTRAWSAMVNASKGIITIIVINKMKCQLYNADRSSIGSNALLGSEPYQG